MTIEFSTETQLRNHLIENFKEYFGFDYTGKEIAVNGGRIDLLGYMDDTVLIVEVKRDVITNATVAQLQRYMDAVDDGKKVVGIAVAPSIASTLDYSKVNESMIIKGFDFLKYVPSPESKIRESTYFKPDVHEWLSNKAKENQITVSEMINTIIRNNMNDPEIDAFLNSY